MYIYLPLKLILFQFNVNKLIVTPGITIRWEVLGKLHYNNSVITKMNNPNIDIGGKG